MINLVIDNWAQWFVVVPGAINLVQGPSNYEALLRMGVPPDQVVYGAVNRAWLWFTGHGEMERGGECVKAFGLLN